MNSLQRVRTVLAGKIPDRVPVLIFHFITACREAGIPMSAYRTDAKAIVRAHLEALEKYQYDCIILDTDTTMLAEAMGAKSECSGDETGKIVEPAIKSLEEVDRLRVVNPEKDGHIPALLEAVQLLADQIDAEVAIRGNADQGSFDLACLLRGVDTFLMDLMDDPHNPAIQQLQEVCYQSHLAVHRALIKAGAHFTSFGDSLSGPDLVSPKIYERFAFPYEERLIKTLAAEGVHTVVHICGDTTKILNCMAKLDYCSFELDYKTDAKRAKEVVRAGHVLWRNIDPSGVLTLGTPDLVRQKTKELISLWKTGGKFILNSGCAMPATTPPENIRAFVETAHEEGVY
jgi:MtaA/CmuA family methyltransferase